MSFLTSFSTSFSLSEQAAAVLHVDSPLAPHDGKKHLLGTGAGPLCNGLKAGKMIEVRINGEQLGELVILAMQLQLQHLKNQKKREG